MALSRGFQADTVEVCIDGTPVFRRLMVTTQPNLGLAGSFETTIRKVLSAVTIRVPSRTLTTSVIVGRARRITYLVVSIENGEIICRFSERSVGYV